MSDNMPMDPQNWMEKLAIVEKLGEINVSLAEMRAEIKSLKESKEDMYKLVCNRLNEHASVLFGNGHEGLKTLVDRVYEDFRDNKQIRLDEHASNRTHRLFIYGSLIVLFVQAIMKWLFPGAHF